MDTNTNNTAMIPDEEAELYDRQIRLWGANTQKIIRGIKALVIGMRGVGAELCKNLILTGIKSITVMDNETVREEDLESQYFLNPSCVGLNRATASLRGLRNLNPHVIVEADEGILADKPISFYSNFDAVIVTNCIASDIICLNEICRYHKIKFFYADVIGIFGFAFCDLKDTGDEASSSYVSFKSVLNLDSSSAYLEISKRKPKDPSYLVFKILLEFFTQYKRKPNFEKYNGDEEKLMEIRKTVLNKLKVPLETIPIEYLSTEFEEYGPSCVIVGGFLAQEMLKTFYKDRPNCMKFFNPVSLTGTTHNFVSSLSVKKVGGYPSDPNPASVDLLDD